MEKAGKLFSYMLKRWMSKSPRLFVAFQWVATIIVLVASIVLAIPGTPIWVSTAAPMVIAFFSGVGLSSKLTTTDTSIIDN